MLYLAKIIVYVVLSFANDSYQDLPEGIVNQYERFLQFLVVVLESMPSDHEPQRIEHRDIESRMHRHCAMLAHLLQMINEILSLQGQLLFQSRPTYTERP